MLQVYSDLSIILVLPIIPSIICLSHSYQFHKNVHHLYTEKKTLRTLRILFTVSHTMQSLPSLHTKTHNTCTFKLFGNTHYRLPASNSQKVYSYLIIKCCSLLCTSIAVTCISLLYPISVTIQYSTL